MNAWRAALMLAAAGTVLLNGSVLLNGTVLEGLESPPEEKKKKPSKGDNRWWGRTFGDKWTWGKQISATWGREHKLRLDPKTLKKKRDKDGKEYKPYKKRKPVSSVSFVANNSAKNKCTRDSECPSDQGVPGVCMGNVNGGKGKCFWRFPGPSAPQVPVPAPAPAPAPASGYPVCEIDGDCSGGYVCYDNKCMDASETKFWTLPNDPVNFINQEPGTL
jgi:hypothetical protein